MILKGVRNTYLSIFVPEAARPETQQSPDLFLGNTRVKGRSYSNTDSAKDVQPVCVCFLS